jgi:hypothetical protein
MPIVVTCPGCPTKLSAPDSAAGKQIRCPKCGAVAPVPNLIPAEEVPVVEAKVTPPKPKPKPVEAEAVEEERPRKRVSRRDEDDDDKPPRKKKRRYDDDDDDYDHDHRRPRRKSGGGGGMVAVIVIGGLLLLAGVGAAVYFLTGKGGALAKKSPPPPGWKQYSKDGFKAYFPNDPASFSMNGFQLGNVGGRFGRNDISELEGVSAYATLNLDGQANATVAIYRFRNRVPASMRDNLRDINPQFGQGERRSVRWLGYSGDEVTTKAGVMRVVCADRLIVLAAVNGPNGTRAKPEVEDGFFDNFELTK